jgi:sec-independent protein translocase protein TatA
MPDIGLPEIIIILLVVVILFGAKKLPELARSLGRSSSEFKKGMREGAADDRPVPDPRTEPRSETTATGAEEPPAAAAGEDRPSS